MSATAILRHPQLKRNRARSVQSSNIIEPVAILNGFNCDVGIAGSPLDSWYALQVRQAIGVSRVCGSQMITPIVARLLRDPFDRPGWLVELK
jgi:hypothetical protein